VVGDRYPHCHNIFASGTSGEVLENMYAIPPSPKFGPIATWLRPSNLSASTITQSGGFFGGEMKL
jgi:hypothetical protein